MAHVEYLGWRRATAIAVGTVLCAAALAKIFLPAAQASVSGGKGIAVAGANAAMNLHWLIPVPKPQ